MGRVGLISVPLYFSLVIISKEARNLFEKKKKNVLENQESFPLFRFKDLRKTFTFNFMNFHYFCNYIFKV
jgi:hypothetical protein